MSGQQWFLLTGWGRRYLRALDLWRYGLLKDKPKVADYRPAASARQGTTLPGETTGVSTR